MRLLKKIHDTFRHIIGELPSELLNHKELMDKIERIHHLIIKLKTEGVKQ